MKKSTKKIIKKQKSQPPLPPPQPQPEFEPFETRRSFMPSLAAIGWFATGALIGLFFFASFVFIYFKNTYTDVVYPGVAINGVDFGKKSKEDVKEYFDKKNAVIAKSQFIFTAADQTASVSAEKLEVGYDADLLAEQAYSIGRTDNTITNISLIFQAYLSGVSLTPAYRYSDEAFKEIMLPFQKKINIEPVSALFTFQNGRVSAFRPSIDGKKVNTDAAKDTMIAKATELVTTQKPKPVTINLPIVTAEPETTTEEANDLGIRELVATGTSSFVGSIPNRAFNIQLAASRLNGILIKPGETFSFNKALGDVSTFTGYKQAYVIQGGRTVLGDGGGVCQVSTTFFRAILNAGLPVIERNPHAYRVGYYEQDSGPGVDAAIYVPTVDLKFKNDTKHHLLVQTYFDPQAYSLTFELYGTKDGREVTVTDPVVTSTSPAPEPLYQDDPTLPKGEVKQVDFAAAGASVYFTRTVKKDGKVISTDTFRSTYRPWQAVFLRGTKEG